MTNNAKTLLDSIYVRNNPDQRFCPRSPTLDAVLAVIDHFNNLHFSDRDRIGKQIAALAQENTELRRRLSAIEHKGDAA